MSDSSYFERCEHDRKNPYSMISNELIRDKNLSPQCRWLIIYLLANKDGWEVRVSEIAKHLEGHLCKDTIYKIINEAIEAGYIRRLSSIQGGLKRYVYKVSETPKFKESLPYPEKPDTVLPDAVKPDTPKDQSSSYEEEKKEQLNKQQQPPTPLKGETAVDDCKISYSDESDLEYTHPNGSKASISVSLIFQAMVGLPYSNEQILEALQKARNAQCIREPIGYIKAILNCPKGSNPLTKNEECKKTTVFENQEGDFKWKQTKTKSQGQSSTISGRDMLARLCQN